MNSENETEYDRVRLKREKERDEKERQKRRERRINKIKRWTSKLSTIAISALVGMLVYNLLLVPVDVNTVSTVVTGEGSFDKIVINYEMVGDSTTKVLLVTVEVPDEEFISVTGSWSFYDRSIDFFITVYIDALAQPSEHFVLRTEEAKTISCKDNISISFVFGAMRDVVLPLWEINIMVIIGIPVLTFAGLAFFLIYSWDRINYRWRDRRY